MTTPMTWTTAGFAALVNAANTGTLPVQCKYIALGTGTTAAAKADTALQTEIKRIETIGGTAVDNNVIHVVLRDESADAYSATEVGLIAADGTLLARYAQATPLITKAAGAVALLAIDASFTDVDTTQVSFGDITFSNPPWGENTQGVVQKATQAQAEVGTDNTTGMTPRRVIDLLAKAPARAALGVTTNPLDTTAGRLLQVEDFGIGKSPTPDIGYDFNESLEYTGVVAPTLGENAVDSPYSSWGGLFSYRGKNNNQAGQIYLSNSTYPAASKPRLHIRTRPANGQPTSWTEVWTSANTGKTSGLTASDSAHADTLGEQNYDGRSASEDAPGIVKLATAAEALAGSEATKAVTAAVLKAVTDALIKAADETDSGILKLATAALAQGFADDTTAMTPKKAGIITDYRGIAISQPATFTKSSNNIASIGIVPALHLELGDVIQISGTASNNFTMTVETITDNDNIVCNYEHRGGAGTLSLTDEAAAGATIKLLCKWYMAPAGLGQAWVNVISQRADNTNYSVSFNRPVQLRISCNRGQLGGNYPTFYLNDILASNDGISKASSNESWQDWDPIITPGTLYKVNKSVGFVEAWLELR